MNVPQHLIHKYNTSSSLFVLTSFPKKEGEVAEENAVARYSHLLLQNFPQDRQIVVLCEKRDIHDEAYELTDNILVVPTFTTNSPKFAFEVISKMRQLNKIKSLMVQFEFSIFGGKVVLPGMVAVLATARLMRVHTVFMFHQVIRDLGKLSGHLGIGKRSLYRNTLNTGLSAFYSIIGILSDTIIVHDSMLKKALVGVVSGKKIVIIPHGCGDTHHLSPNLRSTYRRKLGIEQNDLVILAYVASTSIQSLPDLGTLIEDFVIPPFSATTS